MMRVCLTEVVSLIQDLLCGWDLLGRLGLLLGWWGVWEWGLVEEVGFHGLILMDLNILI